MKKPWKTALLIVTAAFAVLVLFNVFSALTASNTVPPTRADKESFGLGANELKPPQCAGMGLSNVVDYGAGENGTDANDLILGTPGQDTGIQGGAGNDCILAGAGDDRWWLFIWWPGVYGGDGDDVIIGGPGNDVCYGGAGSNTYYGCETIW